MGVALHAGDDMRLFLGPLSLCHPGLFMHLSIAPSPPSIMRCRPVPISMRLFIITSEPGLGRAHAAQFVFLNASGTSRTSPEALGPAPEPLLAEDVSPPVSSR